ncbi:hypothetical protein PJI17_32335, partial [Mycobacterium kansasii]
VKKNLNSDHENEEDLQDAYNALYKESCKITIKLKLGKEKFSKLKENFDTLVLEKSHILDYFEKTKCNLDFKTSFIENLKSENE